MERKPYKGEINQTRENELSSEVMRKEWELEVAHEELGVDALTRVHNRRFFDKELELVGKKARGESLRVGEKAEPFSIIYADIDFFKKVNDTYGHAVGDEVLKEFAKCLQGFARESDVVARNGGEEFAIILKHVTAGFAKKRAEEIREAVENLSFSNPEIKITASFGVASSEDTADEKEVVRLADLALYEAKHTGRNKVERAITAQAA
jgi:diguanylate cyclase (GGDEF)-like protein